MKEPVPLQRRLHNLSVVQTRSSFKIEAHHAGKRLDAIIVQRYPWMGRGLVKSLADQRRILRNGIAAPAGRKAREGDTIVILHSEPWEDLGEMDRITWETLYEDDHILALNKPPHLVVHPAGGYRYTTLLNALHRKYLGDRTDLTEDDKVPRLAHRIDKETSGVLVVAFSREAHAALSALFEDRSNDVHKEYLALVEGCIPWDERDVELPIGPALNDPIRLKRAVSSTGQYARTLVQVVERFALFSLVRCRLFTGRQHQIRVHMSALGHPLVGDHLYGRRDELRESELFDATAKPFRHDGIYLDASVPDEVAAERIRDVDRVRREEYWSIVRGEVVMRPGCGRLLLSRCALHCATMAFPHPIDGREMVIQAPPTLDLQCALAALRRGSSPAVTTA